MQMALAWLSVAFIAGIVAGEVQSVPVGVALLAALLAGALAIPFRRSLLLPLLGLAAFALGIARAPHPGSPGPHDLAFYAGRTVQLQGVVSEEPDIRDTGANYQIDVQSMTVGGVAQPIHGVLAVHTTRAVQLEYGDNLQLRGRLRRPSQFTRLGTGATMQFPRLIDNGPASTGFRGWLMRLRLWLEGGINRWLPEPGAALLIAITLGARSASLGDLAPALVTTGLIHLVAISGIKVAMVAGTVHAVARRLGNRLATLLVSLTALVVYVLLTGATPAGIRSAGMWALVFVALYLGRGTVTLLSLGSVAAAMVAWDPALLWDTGFQMSTIGTFAIIAFSERVQRLVWFLISPFREAFGVTVAAQLGTMPISAVSFHIVSVTGPFANALVLPLLPTLIVLGALVGAVASIPMAASPLAGISYALLQSVVQFVYASSTVSGVQPFWTTPYFTLGYYALLSVIAWKLLARSHWNPNNLFQGHTREMLFTACIGTCGLTWSLVQSPAVTVPQLYWLGSGHALLLRTSHSAVLIDGSPRPFQLLQRLGELLPWNERTLDAVIVTDPRAANVGGLTTVLDHYHVSEVLDVGAQYPSKSYVRWRTRLRAGGIPVFALRTRSVLHAGGATVTALAPDALYSRPQDSAGILRVTLPRGHVVLALGASTREQEEALFRPVNLRANVLLIDVKTISPDFVKGVGAGRVLVSGATVAGGLRLPLDRTVALNPP